MTCMGTVERDSGKNGSRCAGVRRYTIIKALEQRDKLIILKKSDFKSDLIIRCLTKPSGVLVQMI